MRVELKINGSVLEVETDNLHKSFFERVLEYGVRRYVNDSYSGEKGQLKFDLCAALVAKMNAGEELVTGERRSKVPTDPIRALAHKLAKTALVVVFKNLTGKAKLEDMAQHEKVSPYFIEVGGKLAWNEEAVGNYVERRAAKDDFMGQAEKIINATEDDMDL